MDIFKKIIITIVATFILAELSFRLLTFFGGVYSGKYLSPYNQKMDTWYFLEEPNSNVKDEKDEFSYSYLTNDFGGLKYVQQDTSGWRILVLGDSYSFGIGAHQDSSWAVQLKGLLEAKAGRPVYLINASRQGSDPFFSYMVYRDILASLKPDIILLGMNSSDLYEVYARGGYERFKPDGTTITKPAPWYEWMYRCSHLVRFLFRIVLDVDNAYLYSNDQLDQIVNSSEHSISSCLADFEATAHQHNAQLIPFIFSLPWEIKYGHKDKILTLSDRKALSQDIISIRDCMNDYYQTHDISSYYWPEDRHYNAKGYKVMAECLSNRMIIKFDEL